MILREKYRQKEEQADFTELAEIAARSEPPKPTAELNQSEPEPEPPPQGRNLAPLYAQNRDFLGWLCIPGTEIDYPIMHTPSNPQKYLRRSFDGKYSVSGVPFLDYRCSAESDNLIVYGHNMKNGTMFGTLKRYTDRDFLDEHPIIECETESGCARYKVFAVAYVQKTDDWYSFIDAEGEADYAEWIKYIHSKAMLTADIVPAYGQRLLTLSTCHGSGKDGRLLVVAARIQ